MYGDQYSIAAGLYFVAISLLVARTVNEAKTHEKRVGVSIVIIVLGAGVFIFSLKLIEHRQSQVASLKQASQAQPPSAPIPNLPNIKSGDTQDDNAVPVYEPFRPVYEEYKDKLGMPIKKPEPRGFVHHSKHQGGTVIWFDEPGVFYRLDPKTSTWTARIDDDRRKESFWGNDDELTKLLHLPKDCKPPFSGVAKMWKSKPEDWEWLGCRDWHCIYVDYENPAIYIQEFNGGIIMGGFARNADNDPDYGAVAFVLFKENQEYGLGTLPKGTRCPVCLDPVRDKEEIRAKGLSHAASQSTQELSTSSAPKPRNQQSKAKAERLRQRRLLQDLGYPKP